MTSSISCCFDVTIAHNDSLSFHTNSLQTKMFYHILTLNITETTCVKLFALLHFSFQVKKWPYVQFYKKKTKSYWVESDVHNTVLPSDIIGVLDAPNIHLMGSRILYSFAGKEKVVYKQHWQLILWKTNLKLINNHDTFTIL